MSNAAISDKAQPNNRVIRMKKIAVQDEAVTDMRRAVPAIVSVPPPIIAATTSDTDIFRPSTFLNDSSITLSKVPLSDEPKILLASTARRQTIKLRLIKIAVSIRRGRICLMR